MIGRAVVRAWVSLALVLGGAGAARAQNFNFSYMFNGLAVMGTFVTTSQGNGRYLINNILNRTRGNSTLTLLAPGQGPVGTNDYILKFPTVPYFTANGVSYSSNGTNYAVFYQNGYFEHNGTSGANPAVTDVIVTAVAVPAPLPGGGLLSFLALGLAGLIHRRRAVLARGREALARLGLRPAAGPA